MIQAHNIHYYYKYKHWTLSSFFFIVGACCALNNMRAWILFVILSVLIQLFFFIISVLFACGKICLSYHCMYSELEKIRSTFLNQRKEKYEMEIIIMKTVSYTCMYTWLVGETWTCLPSFVCGSF